MKNRGAGPFWSLSPRLTPGRLQLASGLVAITMLGALVTGQSKTGPPAAHAAAGPVSSRTRDVPADGEPSVFPRTCIKRVVDLTRKYPELDIVAVIDRECFSPSGVAPAASRVEALPICARAPRWQLASPRPVPGCLMG